MVFIMYGTDRPGLSRREDCSESFPDPAALGLGAIPLLQDEWPVLNPVRPG